jgi:hypothetical protein
MNIWQKIAVVGLAVLTVPLAWADVFKCVDDDGHVTYTNSKPSAKAKCTVLSRDQRVSTVPGRAEGTPSPTRFPKVDGETQKGRDNDRRRILEQELAAEQKLLEQAKKELAEQEATVLPQERNVGGTINAPKVQERLQSHRDKVALHERNIEALKKEIGNLK